MTTTPDKDIHKQLVDWYNSQKEIIEQRQKELKPDIEALVKSGQAIQKYAKTGELDESLLPIIDGIPHEADNIHNGGAAVPSGVLTGSEALYGFVGWLTSRDEAITFSSTHDASYPVDLLCEFYTLNGLEDPRDNWTDYLTMPKTPENKGWRDDVPDESKADGEETMVEQEAHDHGGIVVVEDVWQFDDYDEILVLTVDCPGDNIVSFDETDRVFKTSRMLNSEDWTLLKPSPLREQDEQDADNGLRSDQSEEAGEETGETTSEGDEDSNSESVSEGVEELKDVADEQDLELSQSETVESDVLDGDAEPSDKSDDSSSDADLISVDAENGENHTLASWIMEQEWVENITADITEPEKISYVMGEYVLEGGTVVNIEELFSDFTPKGWERFDPEQELDSQKRYDCLHEQPIVVYGESKRQCKINGALSPILFIREHKEDSPLMGPDNFQSREFAGEGDAVDVVNSEKVKIFDTILNKVYEVDVKDEQETDPAIHSTHCTEDVGNLLGAAGDVCDDQSTGSNRADVGRDQEPSGANGESTPAEYDDEITKEQHEKIVADTEQYQDQSQYQIVSGEPWSEQEAELKDSAEEVKESSSECNSVQIHDNSEAQSSGDESAQSDGHLDSEDNGLEYLIKEQAEDLTEAEQKAVDLIEGRVGDELDKLEGVE